MFSQTSRVGLCTYHLLPRGWTPETSPGNPWEPRVEWYSFGVSFFPAGEGSCLVLETTSLDHGDIPTGFVRGSATGKVNSDLPGTMVTV